VARIESQTKPSKQMRVEKPMPAVPVVARQAVMMRRGAAGPAPAPAPAMVRLWQQLRQ
jgi:hypothetical protein